MAHLTRIVTVAGTEYQESMEKGSLTLLFYLDTLKSGVICLSSSLSYHTGSADYILEDGVLKNYGHTAKGGFNFYPIDIPYKIIYPNGTAKIKLINSLHKLQKTK